MLKGLVQRTKCLLGRHFFVLQWCWTSTSKCEITNACLYCKKTVLQAHYTTGTTGYERLTAFKNRFLGGSDA
jgi:hypothetical protein